jgi:hypothetical protein
MDENEPRAVLDRLIKENHEDYAGLSKMIGRNAAYIQQFIRRGTPKRLGEEERGILARHFGVEESLLGAPASPGRRRGHLRLVPKLEVSASAGSGALADLETLSGRIGFDEKWLKQLGCEPGQLSLIRVVGDSMTPTLMDGDDIMVDTGAAHQVMRDGIYVIRMDDVLMVKRLTHAPGGRISILSDNPVYPDWTNMDGKDVAIVGRVVWAGRRF